MKTIFITIGESFAARNVFRTDFWPIFLKNNPRIEIILLTVPDKKEYYEKSFGSPNVTVEGLNSRFRSRVSGVVASLARSGIKNHTNLWSKMRSYERGDSGFAVAFFKRALTFLLGNSASYKRLLRFLFLRTMPTRELVALFEKYKPGLLFATSLTHIDFDVPIAVEAKRRGIRTVGMVRSWDNFSSHGLLRFVPDRFLLQNVFLKEMAYRYQAMSEGRPPIDIIGLPHYDFYKRLDSFLETREAFFNRMGLDPQKKLILYGAMGDFLFPHEGEIADVLEQLISSKKIHYTAQVIFRAHPKFQSPFERMKTMRYVKPDRGATYLRPAEQKESSGDTRHFIHGDLRSMEMELSDMRHLINSLYHSDVVVTGASTMAIDAAVLDKPTVCVGFNGLTPENKVPYWVSVRRFYDTYTHFEALMETGGARLADNPDELAAHINSYIEDPSQDREKRRKIVEKFVEPFDGKASERLEHVISSEVDALFEK